MEQNSIFPNLSRVLLSGVDTCELGLYVHFGWGSFDEILSDIRKVRDKAREWNKPLQLELAGKPVDDVLVHKRGQDRYPLLLELPSGHFLMRESADPENGTPNVLFKPYAQWLWKEGIYVACEACQGFLRLLDGKLERYHLTTVAVCVDAVFDRPFTNADLGNAENWSIPYIPFFDSKASNEGEVETLYIGRKSESPERLTIYNKLLECEKHDNWYFLDLYGREVLMKGNYVYRFEWTYKRERLKKWDITSIEDLIHPGCEKNEWLSEKAQAMVLKSFCQSARITTGTDQTKSRRPNDPLWETLLSAVVDNPAAAPKQEKKVYAPCGSDYYFEKAMEFFERWSAKYAQEHGYPDVVEWGRMLEAFDEKGKQLLKPVSFPKNVQEIRKQHQQRRANWEAYKLRNQRDEEGQPVKISTDLTPEEQDEIPF